MTFETRVCNVSELQHNTGQIPDVPTNPRFIRDERFKALKKSIQEDPEMLDIREVVAYDYNGQLVVVLGNMRFRAICELGYKEVRVKILPFETPARKLRAYVIKDNVNHGEHDFDLLANDWEMDELKFDGLLVPDIMTDNDISNFFEKVEFDANKDSHKIVFSFSKSEFDLVEAKLKKIPGTKENTLLKLLDLI